jgi:hypothetical protein
MNSIKRKTPSVWWLGCVLCVCACVCGMYFAGPGQDCRVNAEVLMTDAQMANMIGGQCADCNDCQIITTDTVFYECYHTTSEPNCDEDLTKCIKNMISTSSCKPNQGDGATGCDTDTRVPYAALLTQEAYLDANAKCVYTRNTFHTFRTIYYGCDTSDGHWCHGIAIEMACDTGPCPGNVILTVPREHSKECGC